MKEHPLGHKRDHPTVGADITFVRQVQQGMFDDSPAIIGSDEGTGVQDDVKMEPASGSQEASLSTESAAPIFVNRLLLKPEKQCPFTDLPQVVSRKGREQRDASSSEMARDVPGVLANAPTELDSTPPSLHSMRIDPQIAKTLSAHAAEAMAESGHNSGLGIPGRLETESCISFIAPDSKIPLKEEFCNVTDQVTDHPEQFAGSRERFSVSLMLMLTERLSIWR